MMEIVFEALKIWTLSNPCVIPYFQGIVTGLIIYYLVSQMFVRPQSLSAVPISPPHKLKEECKMVLIVRHDLQMGKGKVAAQCSHATLAAYQQAQKTELGRMCIEKWESEGTTKITLKCPDEANMLQLQKEARAAGLVAKSILDAGRTQIAAGSRTVLAIGPGPISTIDKITRNLKLY